MQLGAMPRRINAAGPTKYDELVALLEYRIVAGLGVDPLLVLPFQLIPIPKSL